MSEKGRTNEDRPEGPINLNLDFGEWGLLAACMENIISQILRKEEFGNKQLDSTEKNMIDRITNLQILIDGQVRKTTNHLPPHEISNGLDQSLSINQSLGTMLNSVNFAIYDQILLKIKNRGQTK